MHFLLGRRNLSQHGNSNNIMSIYAFLLGRRNQSQHGNSCNNMNICAFFACETQDFASLLWLHRRKINGYLSWNYNGVSL